MPPYIIRPIQNDDDVSGFDCGKDDEPLNETLNRYLQERAQRDLKAHATLTWVAADDLGIVGYYSSVFGSLAPEKAPKKAKNATHPFPVPVFIIARLAVDKGQKKKGIGARLILHAYGKALEAADIAGVRLVTVDALRADLKPFYAKFGFESYDDLSMFISVKDVKNNYSGI